VESQSAEANPSAMPEMSETRSEQIAEVGSSASTLENKSATAAAEKDSTADGGQQSPDVSSRPEEFQTTGNKGPSDNKLRATAPLFLPVEQPSSEKGEDAPDPLRAKAHAILSAAANRSAASQLPIAQDSPEMLRARLNAIHSAAANRAAAAPSAAHHQGQAFSRMQVDVSKQEIMDRLPHHCRRMLRHWCQDPMTGATAHYYLGTLKSYSVKSGYGFLQCEQSFAEYGVDVFVHKNVVKTPWHLGQAVEFMVMLNNRSQPQAIDVLWLPDRPTTAVAPKAASAYPATFSAAAPMPAQSGQAKASQGVPLAPMSTPAAAQVAAQPAATAAAAAIAAAMPTAPLAEAAAAAGTSETVKLAAMSNAAKEPAINPIALLAEVVGDFKNREPSGPAADPSPPAPASSTAVTVTEGPRYFGTLKSFSTVKGYGFLACEEVWAKHQRDTYFDKSQMSVPFWNIGQTVEFMLTLNARQQPLARHIDWDPVPLLPKETPDNSQGQPKFRTHQKETLEKLKKLRDLLNQSNLEGAVVQAIDNQGASSKETEADAETDIDYVTYVFDRSGPITTAVTKLKDFVKMLSLLMVAKMLRKKHKLQRLERMVQWIGVLSQNLDPMGVQQHYQDVVSQVEQHVKTANNENAEIQQFSPQLQASIKHLKVKGNSILRPALPAGPVNIPATGIPRTRPGEPQRGPGRQ